MQKELVESKRVRRFLSFVVLLHDVFIERGQTVAVNYYVVYVGPFHFFYLCIKIRLEFLHSNCRAGDSFEDHNPHFYRTIKGAFMKRACSSVIEHTAGWGLVLDLIPSMSSFQEVLL